MIVYNSISGEIVAEIPNDQNPLDFFYHYPVEFKQNLVNFRPEDSIPSDLKNYRVINGKLVRKSEYEVSPPIEIEPTPEQLEIESLKKQVSELTKVIDIIVSNTKE